MFHAAVVPVHGHPVFQFFPVGENFRIPRIRVAQEIPGGTGPVGHGIRFPVCLTAAYGTGGVDPVCHGRQG